MIKSELPDEGVYPSWPAVNSFYASLSLQGILMEPNKTYKVGEQYTQGDMQVTIKQVLFGMPSVIVVEFQDAAIKSKWVWQYFDWESSTHKTMDTPKIGEVIHFPGPLD